jgi:Uma2 family endonuclease
MGLAIKKDKRYTYQDYLTWPEDERWEIIDGAAYNMSPAPKVKHQRIPGDLFNNLKNIIDARCPVFFAPTDVVFDDFNIVQPDILVVYDRDRITEDNIQGVPDLIVEVVSPATELKDRREKKVLYEQSGVKEYIIVFPDREYVERYCLKDNQYSAPDIFNWDEILKLCAFEIEINLWDIFEKEREETGKEE